MSETLAHHVAVSARAGDEDAIGVLLDAALAVHVAAPASAARWIADAIEPMPPEPAERRREWMVQLAGAQAAAGQVEQARTTLLAALDLVPAEAVVERVRLTVRSVGLDRLLGRHHDGHERASPDARGTARRGDRRARAAVRDARGRLVPPGRNWPT